MPYEPSVIEPRWQAFWEEQQTFRTVEDPSRPKYYVLDMFPYPSGSGLHVGHPEGYTATDIVARYKRMQGFNVLHPMGWDAFGLPAERSAMREGIHPAIITKRNTDNFRGQVQRLGFSYDWDREIDTSSSDYYRWTQWIFLRLHERGLAYQAEVAVNWCPALGTVLANEEVSPDGTYKETGDPVEKRMMKQWMLRITAYAERLLEDLEGLDWPEPVKKMQRDWIGRSEGAEVDFAIQGRDESFTVFTTRPDTLFGATYCVLAPEHELVERITTDDQREAVSAYVTEAGRRSERDRRADAKDKTGVFTGAYAINPVDGAAVPIWIADYVLASYGTGAIMAVPAHDERDFAFARAFDLPIRVVVKPTKGSVAEPLDQALAGHGVACNSGAYDGLSTADCKARITADLEERGVGRARVQFALRDWLFSRQRYWGEPFPMLIGADGEVRPLADSDLPVELPHIDAFKPTADGRPPLARAGEDWLSVPDADGGAAWERETNTMPQWAGSCWYYLRFMDPHNTELPVAPEKEKYWGPVDLYIGGTEHAVLHLLYARFWHKVLYDVGLVHTKEPFQKLFNQGMIRAWSYRDEAGRYYAAEDVVEENGQHRTKDGGIPLTAQVEKMGKSKLNSVNPDDVVRDFGADSLRLYEMFMGPLEMAKPWDPKGIEGVNRFLHRVWRLVCPKDDDALNPRLVTEPASESLERLRHKTVAAVTEDLEALRFNTAISRLMEMLNALNKEATLPRGIVLDFLRLLGPFAPHIGEELWRRLGETETIAFETWPSFDPALLVEDQIVVPVQVNGKVRARLEVAKEASAEEIEKLALADPSVQKYLGDKPPRKVIYVPGRLLNIVAAK